MLILPDRILHNPALLLIQYYNYPVSMSELRPVLFLFLFLLFLLPALVIEMSFQPPYNHSHIMTYPLLKFQLMLHQESHVLLQSSEFQRGYLPDDLRKLTVFLHDHLSLMLCQNPFAILWPVEILFLSLFQLFVFLYQIRLYI